MISPKTLFLNADKSKVVPEGSKEAAFLLVRAGQEVSDADAEKYGIGKAEKHEEKSAEKADKSHGHGKK